MSKKLSIFLYLFTLTLILGCLVITAGSFILKDLKYYTENALELFQKRTGYTIELSDIHITGSGVRLNHFRIITAENKNHVLSCTSLLIQIKLIALLKREIKVARIILKDPVLKISGIKDGNWFDKLPFPFAMDSEFYNDNNTLFHVRFSPDKITFHNGRLLYQNSYQNVFTSLDKIYGDLTVTETRGEYSLTAVAEHTRNDLTGELSINSIINFGNEPFVTEKLTARGKVKLLSVPASGFIPDVKRFLSPKYHGARLNGTLRFQLHPEFKYNASGNISFIFQKKRWNNSARLLYTIRGSRKIIFVDRINIIFPGHAQLEFKARLSDPGADSWKFQVSQADGFVNIESLTDMFATHCFPPVVQLYLDKILHGKLSFDGISVSLNKTPPDTLSCNSLSGTFALSNSKIQLTDRLPPTNISKAIIKCADGKLEAKTDIHFFENDNSTVSVFIDDFLDRPSGKATFASRFDAPVLNALIALATQAGPDAGHFLALSGSASVHGSFRLFDFSDFRTTINLTDMMYRSSGQIIKPAGLNNFVYLSTDEQNDLNRLAYNFKIRDSFLLTGVLSRKVPYAVTGTYRFSNFNLAQLEMKFMPATLRLSGKLSGAGKFSLPAQSGTVLPITGKMNFNEFTLTDIREKMELIKISLAADILPQKINVLRSGIRLGVTDISAAGNLTSAVPPVGALAFKVNFFDIDDFVAVIRTIVRRMRKNRSPVAGAKNNPFKKTNLEIDLKVKSGNYLKWDFDNATSRFIYQGATLTWDKIRLHMDTGTVTGKVIYDYTRPGQYRLEFYPQKTDIDFTTLIPAFKKNKKIIGRTNLSGSFKSIYRRGREIIPNMNGFFRIQMKNGEIRRSKLFSTFLKQLRLSKKIGLSVFDEMYKSMPFDFIDADFIMEKSIFKTDDLVMTSPAINLTAVGTVNIKKNEVDFIVGTQVLKTIGKILGNIPIAGDLFTVDNKALTIGYFHVQGPIENPAVNALPFKSLGLGIKRFFKTILDIPLILIPDVLYDQKKKEN